MNKNVLYTIIIILIIVVTVGCSMKQEQRKNKENTKNNSQEVNFLKITINDTLYTMDLENNETVKALINILPLEINMHELNGNEKYIYLDNSLPTSSNNIKRINAGDVMLYGSNCLVIFYQSFDTTYSYTKIGHINNLPNLGNDTIKVKIYK